MRLIYLITCLIICNLSFGQTFEINEIKNSDIVRLLNNAELFSTNKTNELFFRVYSLGNEPGSAGYDNGEVTEMLYVAVSEGGEWPDQKVYVVGSFYAPKPIAWNNKNSKHPEFTIEFGEFDAKKKVTLIIGLDKMIRK